MDGFIAAVGHTMVVSSSKVKICGSQLRERERREGSIGGERGEFRESRRERSRNKCPQAVFCWSDCSGVMQ